MRAIAKWVWPLASLFLAACGDNSATTGSGGAGGEGGAGGAGGAGGDTTTSTTTSTTTTPTTTTPTGSGGGGGLPGCAGGDELIFGEITAGSLEKTGQEDFYKFKGVKGQVVWIDLNSQELDDVVFDPSYIDSIVTLYDASETRIAQNDNPVEFTSADSRLVTILPADGDYCLRVADCWTVKSNPGSQCQAPQDKDTTYYELTVFELIDDGPGDSYTADPEAGNDVASAAEVEFDAAQSGGYYSSFIWGYYETETDVDVYSFTLPADVEVPIGARASTSIQAYSPGTTGSGSTIATGELLIYDPAALDIPIARLDPTKSDSMRVPLTLDKEYLLFVSRPPGAVEANDFYILTEFPGWGNPLETANLTNDLFATAETIDFSDADSAFVEGDLSPITDIDQFKVDVPAGMTTVTAVCGARTQGSGLRGTKITLLGDNGMPLTGGTDIETSTQLAQVSDVLLGNNAMVVLKVEAASQAPDASGTYYQCGIHFAP